MKSLTFYNRSVRHKDYSVRKTNRVEEIDQRSKVNSPNSLASMKDHLRFDSPPAKINKQNSSTKYVDDLMPNENDNGMKKISSPEYLKSIANVSFNISEKARCEKEPGKENREPENDVTPPESIETIAKTPAQPLKCFPIFNFRSNAATNSNSPPKLITKSPISPRMRLRRSVAKSADNPKQLIIDAGQKKFGIIKCRECEMQYNASHPDDQKQHRKHHRQFLTRLKFAGWKEERIVTCSFSGNYRIVKVLPCDPRSVLNQVERLCAVIDEDLGIDPSAASNPNHYKIFYLYVDNQYDEVRACMVAHHVATAYKLLPQCSSEEKDSEIMLHSLESTQVTCGISRMWTHAPYRRKGIATRLLDCVRGNFTAGFTMATDEIAFSSPSPSGRKFAAKYCNTEQFLTYK